MSIDRIHAFIQLHNFPMGNFYMDAPMNQVAVANVVYVDNNEDPGHNSLPYELAWNVQ